MSRRSSSSTTSPTSPLSPKEGVYLFGLEPSAQDFDCPGLENPILKSKASTTIRQIKKHLRKHLWHDEEINLEDVSTVLSYFRFRSITIINSWVQNGL